MWLFKMHGAEMHHFKISNSPQRIVRHLKAHYGYTCEYYRRGNLYYVHDGDNEVGVIAKVEVI